MPKIIDHEEKRILIAEAMWRVISIKGMEGATVRNIAQEAGVSLGALRYYFSNQDELLVFAMTLVQERVTKRIQAVTIRDLPPKEIVINILLELVPITDEALVEMEVWFAFMAHINHRSEKLPIKSDKIYDVVKDIIHFLNSCALLKPELDVDLEVERLYSLIDGLAIHALFDRERINRERITKTIQYHMDLICVK
ncbi:TetR/AcrR family transcriptional regulator [Bacillus bingmayongensis]|uniref:TetR/AcrR family transcriptional regulator n=1 Tax=Bacillus bingmayongensis TaxID=1150157 RepID=UPI0002EA8067|nr:TetR family transcriptional regulator C-terminal domain-containing protein [Bacillus bingmayongensis]MBY0594992.1 TetR family transcriptional regulator C-terminal domain-containing protein [Bacillus bingmayongensis]